MWILFWDVCPPSLSLSYSTPEHSASPRNSSFRLPIFAAAFSFPWEFGTAACFAITRTIKSCAYGPSCQAPQRYLVVKPLFAIQQLCFILFDKFDPVINTSKGLTHVLTFHSSSDFDSYLTYLIKQSKQGRHVRGVTICPPIVTVTLTLCHRVGPRRCRHTQLLKYCFSHFSFKVASRRITGEFRKYWKGGAQINSVSNVGTVSLSCWLKFECL